MPSHPRPHLQPHPPGEPLSPAETRILQVLLAGKLEPLPALLAQLPFTRVLKRNDTEMGPWIDLWVSPEAPRVSPHRFEVSDVRITFEEDPEDGGAVLFVHAGALAVLEILASVPTDFHVRRIRYERFLEPEDPDGEAQFVVVDRRAVDLVAGDIEEARERERRESSGPQERARPSHQLRVQPTPRRRPPRA